MLDEDPDAQLQLQDQIDELNQVIEKLKEENKYYEKKNEELEIEANKAKRANELEAKNNYLNERIETLENTIKELTKSKNEALIDFQEENTKLQMEMAGVKCDLAILNYESDRKLMKYKNYIKKLENKLIGLGYKFKSKKK